MLVDSFALFRAAVAALIEKEPGFEVVAVAEDLDAATRVANGHCPELAILGPNLNHVSEDLQQANLAAAIRDASPTTQIMLVVMTEAEVEFATSGMEAGAAGAITLNSSTEEFVEAMNRIALGRGYISSHLALKLMRLRAVRDESPLSDRELDVLTGLAFGQTNAETAENLHLSVRTVESHRASIQHKLALQSRSDLVAYAIGQGILGRENTSGVPTSDD
ncbi:MAG: response regulator transcription factor [Actinomycetes bacterium]